MPFNLLTWVDRVVQYPNRYKDQNNTQYTFTKDNGTVTSEGTPLNASNFNRIEKGIKENTDVLENLSIYKTSKDSNGIYTVVTYKRPDGTNYLVSTLSGGTSPKYTTRTEQYYDTNGTTLLQTNVYTINYDTDDLVSSEVKA